MGCQYVTCANGTCARSVKQCQTINGYCRRCWDNMQGKLSRTIKYIIECL